MRMSRVTAMTRRNPTCIASPGAVWRVMTSKYAKEAMQPRRAAFSSSTVGLCGKPFDLRQTPGEIKLWRQGTMPGKHWGTAWPDSKWVQTVASKGDRQT